MPADYNTPLMVSLQAIDDTLAAKLVNTLADITALQCSIVRTIVAAFCAEGDKTYTAKGSDGDTLVVLHGHLTMRHSRTVQFRIVGDDGIEYMKISIDTDLPIAGSPQLSKISLYQNPHNAKTQLTNGKADWNVDDVYDQVRRITLRIMKKFVNNNIFVRNNTSRVGSKVFEGSYTQTDHHLEKNPKPDIVNNLGDAIKVAVRKQEAKAEGNKEFHIPVTPRMEPLNQTSHPNLFKQQKKENLDPSDTDLVVLQDTIRGVEKAIDLASLQKAADHFTKLSEDVMNTGTQSTTETKDQTMNTMTPTNNFAVCDSAVDVIRRLLEKNAAEGVKPDLAQDVEYHTMFVGNTPLFTYTTAKKEPKAEKKENAAGRTWTKPSTWFKKAEQKAADQPAEKKEAEVTEPAPAQ